MRAAMADAEVGNDSFGEDPTVNRLQSLAASLMGKEAALYTPSGRMANQIAIRLLARPGTEVLCPERAHVYRYEDASAGLNNGVQLHPLWDVPGGIRAAVDGVAHHLPQPSLVVLENTYMAASGAPLGVEEMRELCARAHEGGLRVHLDGARIWNAALAVGASPRELVADTDTMMFCFSKGLGAPVGSVLCGPADLIAQARTERARFGGGMCQSGVIAAAAIVALETMVDRLADDHARARRLADGLARRWPNSVDPETVRTNIVCAELTRLPDKFVERLAAADVLCATIDPRTVRFVTHKDVDDAGIDFTLAAFDAIASA
jgi:threonine aldolase